MDHSIPSSDGYAIRAKYLLEAQAKAGNQVVALTSPTQGHDAKDVDDAGVQYRRTSYLPWEHVLSDHGLKHLVFGRAIRRGLSKQLESRRFDIVHAHTPFTVARAALQEARLSGLPFIYEKRNLWEESARARGKRSGKWPWFQVAQALDRWVTRRADAVCTITQALKDHTVKLGVSAEKIFVVGNGVDTEAFRPRKPPSELRAKCAGGGDFVIGFIGSFFSFEGLPLLLEAFSNLHSRFPGARLVLVGSGEDESVLARLVAKYALAESVWITGRVPHSAVIDFYAAMDVLIYPRYQSLLTDMVSPLKPLEPMAMARCVIGSDVGGLRELFNDQDNALLFQAGSRTDLEAKLEMVLSGQVNAARMGENARRYVLARRQWRQMAERYDEAYRYALRRRGG
jgi:PEP-CTERM/exosortase A-associated glycosyltransferase